MTQNYHSLSMRNLFILIFSTLVSPVFGQLVDNFNDGDFTTGVAWSGSTTEFQVNSSGELQLNAATAGEAYLTAPSSFQFSDTIQWTFRIKEAFSPSSSNLAKIYLITDQTDPTQSLNGYYLRFGESLSSDAIELFCQTGTVSVSVCRGPDGQISSSFDLVVKVLRYPTGEWKIFSASSANSGFSLLATGQEPVVPNGVYFSIDCIYTSGNIRNFYFDDIYAGSFIPDVSPPRCLGISKITAQQLTVAFSEKPSSAIGIQNFALNGTTHPISVQTDSTDENKLMLNFATPFIAGQQYQINLIQISDESGNRMNDTSLAFTFYPLKNADAHDIVFSEIYFEMSSLSPLPASEYVELYNRSDSAISLNQWTLSDGSTDGTLTDIIVNPHDYVLLFPVENAQMFSANQNGFGVTDFPGLNNDTGDSLTLFDNNGVVIDHCVFSDETYHESSKANGGWSLERIDLNFTCEDELNWLASSATGHGTPGRLNSVNGMYSDHTAPYLISAWPEDSTHIILHFSEPIENGATTNVFLLSDDQGVIQSPSSISVNSSIIELAFAQSFSNSISLLRVAGEISDCAGNVFDTTTVIRVSSPQISETGDVLINEILFNSYDEEGDFVELFNASSKVIDLSHWVIQEADFDDASHVKEESLIAEDHKLFFPGEYLVLTRNPELIKKHYVTGLPGNFLVVKKLPELNSDEGMVILNRADGTQIDRIPYSEKMHFELISDPKGVSLERTQIKNGSDTSDWHSAASSVGFATPGLRNSHWLDGNADDNSVQLLTGIFSPDNDGFQDLFSVSYKFEKSDEVMSVYIHDDSGRRIKTIMDNQTISTEGIISWDGICSDGRLIGPGRYLVLVRVFDPEGGNRVFKMGVVVAG